MAREELTHERRGLPVVFGDLVIEPVDRSLIRVEYAGGMVIGLALKRPTSVVVRAPAGTFRFDLEHTEVGEDGDRGFR